MGTIYPTRPAARRVARGRAITRESYEGTVWCKKTSGGSTRPRLRAAQVGEGWVDTSMRRSLKGVGLMSQVAETVAGFGLARRRFDVTVDTAAGHQDEEESQVKPGTPQPRVLVGATPVA